MIHKQRVVSCSIISNLFNSPFGVHADKSYAELVIWDSLLFSLHMLCKQKAAVNWPEMVWHSPQYRSNRSRVIEIVELNVPDRSKHENSENWIVQMKEYNFGSRDTLEKTYAKSSLNWIVKPTPLPLSM